MGRSVESIGEHVIYFDVSHMGHETRFKCNDCDHEEFEEFDACPECESDNVSDESGWNDDTATMDWDDFKGNIESALAARFKSLSAPFTSTWAHYPYRENKIILENDLVYVSISEYCGCAAVSIYERPDCDYPDLAENWISSIFNNAVKVAAGYGTVLNRLGTMSNGVSVFQKAGV